MQVGSLEEAGKRIDKLASEGLVDPAFLLTMAKAYSGVKETDLAKDEVKDIMYYLYMKVCAVAAPVYMLPCCSCECCGCHFCCCLPRAACAPKSPSHRVVVLPKSWLLWCVSVGCVEVCLEAAAVSQNSVPRRRGRRRSGTSQRKCAF
jgi:hypothetical protein